MTVDNILSEDQITEFQEIYFRVTGEEISRNQACTYGTELILLFKRIIINNKQNEKREPN
jgi:hypothetical protein